MCLFKKRQTIKWNISHVQFLDAQRIHNLTKYLQALHKAQMATEEHTTLLLNCYTKLKDVSKLDEFIMVNTFLVNDALKTFYLQLYVLGIW